MKTMQTMKYYFELVENTSVLTSSLYVLLAFYAFRFPTLAKMALLYHSIPATEVASERMFSSAGNVLTKLRSQLDSDTVDAILFLHKN